MGNLGITEIPEERGVGPNPNRPTKRKPPVGLPEWVKI